MASLKVTFLLSCALFLGVFAHEIKLKKSEEKIICNSCEDMIDYSRNTFDETTKNSFVEAAHLTVCSRLTNKKECQTIVEIAAEKMYDFIRNDMNTTKICAPICHDKGELALVHLRAINLFEKIAAIESPCESCKTVINDVKEALVDLHENPIVLGLFEDQFCPMFGQGSAMCRQLLKILASDKVINELDSKVCKYIGSCNEDGEDVNKKCVFGYLPSAQDPEVQKIFVDEPLPGTKNFLNPVCAVCKVFLKTVWAAVGQDKVEENIIDELNNLCHKMPILKNTCHNFVYHILDKFLLLLQTEVTAEVACEVVGMCPLQCLAFLDGIVKCDACTHAVRYLEKQLLKSHAFGLEDVKLHLQEVCHRIPLGFEELCASVIDEFGDILVRYILDLNTANDFCQFIQLCQSKDK